MKKVILLSLALILPTFAHGENTMMQELQKGPWTFKLNEDARANTAVFEFHKGGKRINTMTLVKKSQSKPYGHDRQYENGQCKIKIMQDGETAVYVKILTPKSCQKLASVGKVNFEGIYSFGF